MNGPICTTGRTQSAPGVRPSWSCPICEVDRQCVGWEGEQWTTHEVLAASRTLRIGQDAGSLALAMAGEFGIPQCAPLLPAGSGNIGQACQSLVGDVAVGCQHEQGGGDRIAIAHPHVDAGRLELSQRELRVQLPESGNGSWIARTRAPSPWTQGNRPPMGYRRKDRDEPVYFPRTFSPRGGA